MADLEGVVSALEVATVRQRIATALEAVTDWRESRWSYDVLPMAEPSTYAHRTFAVGAVETAWRSPVEASRTRRGNAGGLVDTTIGVRWLWRIRADAQVADGDAALGAEALLIDALSTATSTDMHVRIVRARRRSAGDETWFLGELEVVVTHLHSVA